MTWTRRITHVQICFISARLWRCRIWKGPRLSEWFGQRESYYQHRKAWKKWWVFRNVMKFDTKFQTHTHTHAIRGHWPMGCQIGRPIHNSTYVVRKLLSPSIVEEGRQGRPGGQDTTKDVNKHYNRHVVTSCAMVTMVNDATMLFVLISAHLRGCRNTTRAFRSGWLGHGGSHILRFALFVLASDGAE